jgi:hypothetical protein
MGASDSGLEQTGMGEELLVAHLNTLPVEVCKDGRKNQ